MMSSYYRRVLRMALRDPRKIQSMLRLKTAKTDEWKKDYSSGKIVRVMPPAVIAVRMNYSCNLRCVMCNQWGENGVFIKDPKAMPKREMTIDDFKTFIDDVAQFRPYLYFTGGEPLMNKDIMEVIRHASSRHLITSMSTNSTYLKERSEELIRSGLDYLYTSLDAPAPVAEGKIRVDTKGEDSNAKSAEAIKYFIDLRDKIKAGLPLVQVQTIIVKENQDKLVEMARFVETYLKADMWGLQLCVYTTPELNEQTTRVYEKEFGQGQVQWAGFIREFPGMDFKLLKQQVDEIKKTHWKFKLRLYRPIGREDFDFERYYTRPDEHAVNDLDEATCMNPWVFAQLQPDGEIAFCGSQPDYTIGNVKGSRFMDLWCNEKATRWRHFLAKKNLFASCKRCFALYEFSHFKKN